MKWIYLNILVFRILWRHNAEQQVPWSGETPVCKGDVQGKILHHKLCGRGLTANPRLQFCGGRGSLASIHELTRTENFRIRTTPVTVAGLVILTKVVKIGGSSSSQPCHCKTKLCMRMNVASSAAHTCSSSGNCRELWNTLFSCRDLGGPIWHLALVRLFSFPNVQLHKVTYGPKYRPPRPLATGTKNPQKNLEIRFSYKMAAKTTSGSSFWPYSCSPPSTWFKNFSGALFLDIWGSKLKHSKNFF